MKGNVIHEPEKRCFYIQFKEVKAKLKYKLTGRGIDIHKTKVPMEMRGKGIGKLLVDAALEFAVINRLEVIPSCSFVRHVLKNQEEG